MRISNVGLQLIEEFEGLVLRLYNDPAGHCTIGVGHLVHLGRCDGRGSEQPFTAGITEAQALQLLREDVARFEECINQNIRVALNQNQFDALVSWAYNVGCGNVSSSTLVRLLNDGQYGTVCTQLRRWNKAGGVVLPGLTWRRKAECALFNQPVAPAPPAPPILPREEDENVKVLLQKPGDPRELCTDGVGAWHVPNPTVHGILRTLGIQHVILPANMAPLWDALWNVRHE